MRRKLIIPLILTCTLGLCACDFAFSDLSNTGNYKTQNANSALEYSVYMNKQITVYTNQLSTHIMLLQNSDDNYENIIDLAEESVEILETTLDEVILTYPATSAEDDRLTTIKLMQTATKNMTNYLNDLKNSKSVSSYLNLFQDDYYALTGMANLYYQ